jgi:hypothetical protein
MSFVVAFSALIVRAGRWGGGAFPLRPTPLALAKMKFGVRSGVATKKDECYKANAAGRKGRGERARPPARYCPLADGHAARPRACAR